MDGHLTPRKLFEYGLDRLNPELPFHQRLHFACFTPLCALSASSDFWLPWTRGGNFSGEREAKKKSILTIKS
jgi:hypothetical protein